MSSFQLFNNAVILFSPQTHNYNAVMTVPLSDTVDVSVNAGAGAIRPAPEKNMVIEHNNLLWINMMNTE